jgi:large subunit ribosomal protein L22
MANTDATTVEVSATARYVRMAPRKVRLVVDQIRNKPVDKALEILQFTNRSAAESVAKTLRSAVANAENNNGLRAQNLYVKAAYVDEGPTLKRIRPRAKGSASRINKRTSHITITVAPRKEA